MINKQNLWFVTLFSLIIILGIYYFSMDDDALKVLSNNVEDKEVVEVKDSDVIVALKVKEDEDVLKKTEEYQNTLLNVTTSMEEKNDAYVSLQALNNKKSSALKIEKLIKEKFNYEAFVKIDGDIISVVVDSKEHSAKIANNIISEIQALYKTRKYITIKFE